MSFPLTDSESLPDLDSFIATLPPETWRQTAIIMLKMLSMMRISNSGNGNLLMGLAVLEQNLLLKVPTLTQPAQPIPTKFAGPKEHT